MNEGRQIRIEIERETAHAARLHLAGELSEQTYREVEEVFTCLLAEDVTDIEVDVGGLETMTSCGYGVFLEIIAKVGARGGSIRFSNANSTMRRVFDMLGVA